jgi:hypothetical protein
MWSSPRLRHPLTAAATLSVALLLSLTGCFGGSADEPAPNDSADEVRQADTAERNTGTLGRIGEARRAMEGIRGAAEAMRQNEGTAEAVDFRALRETLPETVAGMERTDASGERRNMGGFSMSTAKGEYEGDDGKLEISVVDAGGAGPLAALGAAWLIAGVDRESSTGYERTTRFASYPAYEKVEDRGRGVRSELQFVVADRFFVTVKGSDVDMAALHAAAGQIDTRALEGMRDEGRAAEPVQ